MGALFCAVLMPLVAGCGDGPLDNVNPGSIEVVISSHGEMLDSNGYQVVSDPSITT